jgi:hypothetical protein
MKKVLFAITSLCMVLISCQETKSKETERLERQSDSMHDVVRRYEGLSKVYVACLKLAYGRKSTNPELDARDMLIVQEGKEKAEWFFAREEELQIQMKIDDSIEQLKLDSLKKLRKK